MDLMDLPGPVGSGLGGYRVVAFQEHVAAAEPHSVALRGMLRVAGSIRLVGNGGLFSYTGRYRNRALGPYQAWVNDMNRTVVLRFAERTLVVSPADPEAFAQEIRRQVTA